MDYRSDLFFTLRYKLLKGIHCIFQLLKVLSPQLQVLKNTINFKHEKCFEHHRFPCFHFMWDFYHVLHFLIMHKDLQYFIHNFLFLTLSWNLNPVCYLALNLWVPGFCNEFCFQQIEQRVLHMEIVNFTAEAHLLFCLSATKYKSCESV